MTQQIDPRDAKGTVSKLLNFEQMIGPSLIKFVYYAGLAMIVLYAIVLVFGGFVAAQYSATAGVLSLLGGSALLVVGTVFWRFSCELWILLFKIYDRLGEVRDRMPPL